MSAFLAAFMLVAVAGANVSGTTGDIVEIAAPSSVVHHTLESNSDIQLFSESRGVVLSKKLRVDVPGVQASDNRNRPKNGVIPKGTEVNSYMLHSDPVERPRRAVKYEGTVTFDEVVLGIVVKSSKLRKTDAELGSGVTDYPDGLLLRGLELNSRGDSVKLSRDGHKVTVKFRTSAFIDQIRIITTAGSNGEAETSESGEDNEGGETDTLSDGLVGHWAFEDGSGQSVTDSSGNGNDGVFGSSPDEGSDDPSWTTDSAAGQYAIEFDGVNDLVDVGTADEFEQPVYSWSLWLKAPQSPVNTSIGQPMSNADEQFVASWDHTHPGFIASAAHKTGDTWVGVQIQNPLTGGEWHHIAATYDGAELSIYLDGNLEESKVVGPANDSEGHLTFGSGYYAGAPLSYFEGKIDDVRIYSRALTGEEVAQLAAR